MSKYSSSSKGDLRSDRFVYQPGDLVPVEGDEEVGNDGVDSRGQYAASGRSQCGCQSCSMEGVALRGKPFRLSYAMGGGLQLTRARPRLQRSEYGAVNPWAVCHASTGPETGAKFERCVQDVKSKHKVSK